MTTQEKAPYFLEKLQEVFTNRKSKNSRYSLRAYAKFLEINPGTLSAILKGKRKISSQEIRPIMEKLQLTPDERAEFIESLSPEPIPMNAFVIPEDHYHLIFEEWEYFVILGLFRLKNFESSAEWISASTEIPVERVRECVQMLFSLRLIEQAETGEWVRVHKNLRSSHNVSSEAIRKSHKNTLMMAMDKLEKYKVEERDFTFMTVGLDEKRLQKLKKLILKFRDDTLELDEQSERTILYRISTQCYPLSKEVEK